MSEPSRRLSVLFVNYNSWRLCTDALRSLRAQQIRDREGRDFELQVVVVDNASPQGDPAAEQELERLLTADHWEGRLIRHDENGGYAKGMNLALSHSDGELVLVCNPDIHFQPGCIQALYDSLVADPGIGAVNPRNYWDATEECQLPPNILPTMGDLCSLFWASISPRQVRRYAARRSPRALQIWAAGGDVELDMLSGCCFLMTRSLIGEIGLFDERFPLYYEDTDLSMRIRRSGRRIVQADRAHLVHYYNRSGATSHDLAMERYHTSRRRYYRKWYGRLGALVYDTLGAIQRTSWARRRAARPPQVQVEDIGAGVAPPVLEFGRDHARLLVEIALDANFYLAGGVLAAGDRWSPGGTLFGNFGPCEHYFRVLDISGPRPQLVGVYKYTRVIPNGSPPNPDLACV